MRSEILISFVLRAAARAYPNGVSSSSPGLVAIGDLPWVEKEMNGLYPNGVASVAGAKQTQPRWGRDCHSNHRTQGSPPTACNPGLEDGTPIGVRGSRNAFVNRSETAGTENCINSGFHERFIVQTGGAFGHAAANPPQSQLIPDKDLDHVHRTKATAAERYESRSRGHARVEQQVLRPRSADGPQAAFRDRRGFEAKTAGLAAQGGPLSAAVELGAANRRREETARRPAHRRVCQDIAVAAIDHAIFEGRQEP